MLPHGVLRLDTPPARLRAVVFLEGLSYLVLLFVAMPLKYWAGAPMAVRIAGLLHGLLFIVLAVLTLHAMRTRPRSFGWGARIALCAIIPFATFTLDRELHADDESYRTRDAR